MSPAHGTLKAPSALLLDFGGVLVTDGARPEWVGEVAVEVHRLLMDAGEHGLTVREVADDIRSGAVAETSWKNAMSRMARPREMTYQQFWGEFVACDWPDGAREVVSAHAAQLCRLIGERRYHREIRSGASDVLDLAARHGIPVAVVSNAVCGAVHREVIAAAGWADRVSVQVYSDEVGIRKPNPDMLRTATRLLSARAEECWYVGDSYDRDVVCGRRAAAGAVILVESGFTTRRPYAVRSEPDAVVADLYGLRDLLESACGAS